jgi:hypothetical protein
MCGLSFRVWDLHCVVEALGFGIYIVWFKL